MERFGNQTVVIDENTDFLIKNLNKYQQIRMETMESQPDGSLLITTSPGYPRGEQLLVLHESKLRSVEQPLAQLLAFALRLGASALRVSGSATAVRYHGTCAWLVDTICSSCTGLRGSARDQSVTTNRQSALLSASGSPSRRSPSRSSASRATAWRSSSSTSATGC